MSSTQQLTQINRALALRGGALSRLRHHAVVPALVGAGLLLAGCAGTASGSGLDLRTPPPVAVPTAAASAPTTTALSPAAASPTPKASATTTASQPKPSPTAVLSTEQQVLAQYRQFFASIRPIWLTPPATRKGQLAKVAIDPQLSTLLKGMAAADQAGEVPYGDPSIKPKVVRLQAALATIEDCQDTSRNGRMKKADRRKVTIGRRGAPALATMRRGADGVWRVASVSYQSGLTC